MLSASKYITSSAVLFKKIIIFFSLAQSSLVGAFTPVVKKDTAGEISCLALLDTNSTQQLDKMRNSGHDKGCSGGNFGRGHGGHGSFKSSSSNNNNNNKPKTKLEDCVFHLGTSRQASDYDNSKDFIINHIKKEFDGGVDMATALNELKKNPKVETWEPNASDYISEEEDPEKKKQLDKILHSKQRKPQYKCRRQSN